MSFLSALLQGLPLVGPIVGEIAAGRAKGRQDTAVLNQNKDQLAAGNYRTQQDAELTRAKLANDAAYQGANVDLQRRAYGDTMPAERARQAVAGNVAANTHDVSITGNPRILSHLVNFEGGLRPSDIGAGGRAAGSELANNAMARLLKGDTFNPLQTSTPSMLTPPGQTPLPQANWLDKLLAGLSYASAGAGVINAVKNGQSPGNSGMPGASYGQVPSGLPGTLDTSVLNMQAPSIAQRLIFGPGAM